MANQEQVDRLLQKGVENWNTWRKQHPSEKIDLSEADLFGANLFGANLNEADLSNANLSIADLRRADLKKADLFHANLSSANLDEADLFRANLFGANLNESNLSDTNFEETNIGWTLFAAIDMHAIHKLETVTHDGPSTIGIDTLVQSEGNIPESFLKGAGVPDTVIKFARSMVQRPIEYYTCFISYSSKDKAFANRLHADLQQRGVRCWFAPEDMKVGDKIRPRIDESIRKFDKLLLILSKYSIASNWVAYEVEKALDKEPKGIPNVLFPIRIDGTILTCNTQWAQDIKQTRHISDFSRWKDHDTYQHTFTRLLHDLKAESST